jgi:hypothetical protein
MTEVDAMSIVTKELPARICNGDLVADKITGFSGIVVAMTQYLDGRVQACVQSREMDEVKPGPEHWFDEYRLRIQIPSEFYVDKRPEGLGYD